MGKKKACYRVTNWKEYNESLVRRGDVTLWFSEDALASWEHANQGVKVGRPFTYSDGAIECLLTLRELFRLPYRQTEGLGRALVKLLEADVAIPDFTSLAKRAAKLKISLEVIPTTGPIDVVVDSTGLKVFGAGEWRSDAYRTPKRRTWRKLHLSINAATQEIVAEVLTSRAGDDARLGSRAVGSDRVSGGDAVRRRGLRQVEAVRRACAAGDSAGDSAAARSVDPPARQLRRAALPRDEAIRGMRRLGRAGWKRESGYHRRSLVETSMSRLKQAFGAPTQEQRLRQSTNRSPTEMQTSQPLHPTRHAHVQMELGDKAHMGV